MTNAKKMAALLCTNATTNASRNATTAPRLTQREVRALCALLRGPVMREALDREVGCSNGPNLVKGLREKGLDIDCEIVESVDRDGRKCRPGRYSLTTKDKATVRDWDCL